MIQQILSHINKTLALDLKHYQSIGGGCIHQAYKIYDKERVFFVKTNQKNSHNMFLQEAHGLELLYATQTITIPKVILCEQIGQYAYLVLEYLELKAGSNAQMGQALAQLHSIEQEKFGLDQDNYIGSTLQPNGLYDNWIDFWREKRLGFQFELAKQNGYKGQWMQDLERLLADFALFFNNYTVKKSLLHGDLWGGNAALLTDNTPVIFDPAVYVGDREADIAMTELFGGFNSNFYQAYQAHLPLDIGYKTRKNLYNLYHILNHLHLFGSSYKSQAQRMISQLLSEI